MPSTPTEALLDVNVLIASVFADHVMHGPARSFVERRMANLDDAAAPVLFVVA